MTDHDDREFAVSYRDDDEEEDEDDEQPETAVYSGDGHDDTAESDSDSEE